MRRQQLVKPLEADNKESRIPSLSESQVKLQRQGKAPISPQQVFEGLSPCFHGLFAYRLIAISLFFAAFSSFHQLNWCVAKAPVKLVR